MTANGLIRKLQNEVARLSTGDIPISINGIEVDDVDVEYCEGGETDFINIRPAYFF